MALMAQNGIPRHGWFKSSLSFANGNCVEVQFTADGGAEMRNSRDREGPVLSFTAREWKDFIAGVRLGEFDS